MDFRGALGAFAPPLPDIGGYWLCLRFRIATGALGGSIAPDAVDAVEEMLLCLVEVLCRRSIEPVLAGSGPDTTLVPGIARPSFEASIVSTERFPPVTLLLPPAAGN